MRGPTISDIASRVGLSRGAVSLALRGMGRLSAGAREKIRAAAEELGYEGSALLSRRMRQVRSGASFETPSIAVVFGYSSTEMKTNPYLAECWRGARRASLRQGFQPNLVCSGDKSAEALRAEVSRLAPVGVVVALQARDAPKLDLDWDHTACVGINHHPNHPPLNTIYEEQFHTTLVCLREMASRGYGRIGCVVCRVHERIHSASVVAAFSAFHLAGAAPRQADDILRFNGEIETDTLAEYITRQRWDGIVSPHALGPHLESAGLRVPDDIGWCAVGFNPHIPDFRGAAGIASSSFGLGESAVNQVIHQLYLGETGLPESPWRLHWHGAFFAGPSLALMAKGESV